MTVQPDDLDQDLWRCQMTTMFIYSIQNNKPLYPLGDDGLKPYDNTDILPILAKVMDVYPHKAEDLAHALIQSGADQSSEIPQFIEIYTNNSISKILEIKSSTKTNSSTFEVLINREIGFLFALYSFLGVLCTKYDIPLEYILQNELLSAPAKVMPQVLEFSLLAMTRANLSTPKLRELIKIHIQKQVDFTDMYYRMLSEVESKNRHDELLVDNIVQGCWSMLQEYRSCGRLPSSEGFQDPNKANIVASVISILTLGPPELLRQWLDTLCAKDALRQDEKQALLDDSLIYATKRGNSEMVRMLVKCSFPDSLRARLGAMDSAHNSALHLACQQGYIDIVRILLEEAGDEVDRICYFAGESTGATPLHAAVYGKQFEIVKLLIEKYGAQPNRLANDGTTPLHLACATGDHNVIRYLIYSANANPFVSRKHSQSCCFQAAAMFACVSAIRMIYSKYESPKKPNYIKIPVKDNELDSYILWTLYLTVSSNSVLGWTEDEEDTNRAQVLDMILTRTTTPDRISKILAMYVDEFSKFDCQSQTLLHACVFLKRPKCLSCLIDNGADITMRTAKGQTALDIAFAVRHEVENDPEDGKSCSEIILMLIDRWEALRVHADLTMLQIALEEQQNKQHSSGKKKPKKKSKRKPQRGRQAIKEPAVVVPKPAVASEQNDSSDSSDSSNNNDDDDDNDNNTNIRETDNSRGSTDQVASAAAMDDPSEKSQDDPSETSQDDQEKGWKVAAAGKVKFEKASGAQGQTPAEMKGLLDKTLQESIQFDVSKDERREEEQSKEDEETDEERQEEENAVVVELGDQPPVDDVENEKPRPTKLKLPPGLPIPSNLGISTNRNGLQDDKISSSHGVSTQYLISSPRENQAKTGFSSTWGSDWTGTWGFQWNQPSLPSLTTDVEKLDQDFEHVPLPENILLNIQEPRRWNFEREFPEYANMGITESHIFGKDLSSLSISQLDTLREFHTIEISKIIEIQMSIAREQGRVVAEEQIRRLDTQRSQDNKQYQYM